MHAQSLRFLFQVMCAYIYHSPHAYSPNVVWWETECRKKHRQRLPIILSCSAPTHDPDYEQHHNSIIVHSFVTKVGRWEAVKENRLNGLLKQVSRVSCYLPDLLLPWVGGSHYTLGLILMYCTYPLFINLLPIPKGKL